MNRDVSSNLSARRNDLLGVTARAFAWNHVARVGEYLLMYVVSVLVARVLGAGLYGAYATFLSMAQMMIVLSSFGLETSLASLLPRLMQQMPDGAVGVAVRRIFLARITGVIIVVAGFSLLRIPLARFLRAPDIILEYLFVLLVYFSFRSLTSLFITYHVARFRTRVVASVLLATRIVEAGGVWFLLMRGTGLREILVWVTATGGVQLLGLIYHARKIFLPGPSGSGEGMIAMGGKFWVNDLLEFILGRQADVLLLGYFMVERSAIGHYDAALGLAQGINTGMTTGLFGVAIASLSAMSATGKKALAQYWELLAGFVVFAVVPLLIFSIVYARDLITMLYSAEFLPSVPLFQIFAAFLISTRLLGGGVAANYLSSAGNVGILLFASSASGVVNLVLAILLIPRWGAVGAVVATGSAALSIAGVHAVYVRRRIEAALPWKPGLVVLFLGLVGATGANLVPSAIREHYPYATFAAFAFIFLCAAYLAKPIPSAQAGLLGQMHSYLSKILGPFVRLKPFVVDVAGGPVVLRDRQKWAYAWMPESSGVAVDVGSSWGPLCLAARRRAREVIAVDLDVRALSRRPHDDDTPHALCASAAALPLRSGTADTVLLLDVLEHTMEEEQVMREVHRILRPGGTLIISVPNRGLFRSLDPQNLSARLKGTYDHSTEHRHYSLDQIRQFLHLRFRIERTRFGGLLVYPVAFALGDFFRKHLHMELRGLFDRLCDIDNDISWGRASYNCMIEARRI